MAYQPYNGTFTRFDEALIANRNSELNLKPTYGISALRYTTSVTGTGAALGETNGEFRLQSGTNNNGLATLITNQRGTYQAGGNGTSRCRCAYSNTSTFYSIL